MSDIESWCLIAGMVFICILVLPTFFSRVVVDGNGVAFGFWFRERLLREVVRINFDDIKYVSAYYTNQSIPNINSWTVIIRSNLDIPWWRQGVFEKRLIRISMKQTAGAIDLVQQLLRYVPSEKIHPSVRWIFTGEAFIKKNQWHDKAAEALGKEEYHSAVDLARRALQLPVKRFRDRRVSTYIVLASAYSQLKQYQEAHQVMKEAEQLRPDSPAVQSMLGVTYRYIGDPVRAEEAFQKAIKGYLLLCDKEGAAFCDAQIKEIRTA